MLHKAARGKAERKPDNQTEQSLRERAAHNHGEYASAAGAERHADADLACTPGDCIRSNPVEPDGGEQQRKQAED